MVELHFERGRIRAVLPNTTGVVIRTETDTFEYPGASVLPGFVDNHAHVLGYGTELSVPSLRECTSASECIDVLKSAPIPSNGWLYAMGWNQELWDDQQMPSADILDAAFPDTPVVASRVDGHAFWINRQAAKRAGINSTSGICIDNDMAPIFAAMPDASIEEKQERILAALGDCLSKGITEVHDMDVLPDDVEVMRGLAETGKLPLRVQSFVSSQERQWEEHGTLPAGGELQRTVGIKMFADGALGSRGAALLSPYTDDPSTSGELLLSKEFIVEMCRRAIEEGWWAVAVHAIGDAAVRRVLDAYEEVRSWDNGQEILLRIEHAQHVHPDDLLRFKKLDVIACIQPEHCTSDALMAEARLGEERLPWAYPWKSLLDLGTRIGGGSDFPIEPPSPINGIVAFTSRRAKATGEPWQAQEVISREEAVRLFTQGGHDSVDVGYRRGTIKIGYDADVVILDRDILTCSDEELAEATVLATFVAGQLRYSA